MKDETTAPFIFGVKVQGDTFTDRMEETERLKMNFLYGVNTILISPRRMGKTSLVEKVCMLVESSNVLIVRLDVFGCRSEEDFINAYSTAIIRATSTKWEEWMNSAKKFLAHLAPKISIGTDPMTDFSISLQYGKKTDTLNEILELPEKIAKERGCSIVVCIDEFQQIGEFPESIVFQKKLRSVWQLQEHVSYCLYGSKKHMMENIFQSRSNPFYRFGDLMYLGKISEEDWVAYICQRFEKTGKCISAELAKKICDATERYSSYVQQLAWFVWLKCSGIADQSDIDFAIERLLDACEPLFIQQTESLSSYQMNFLHAIADGIHTGFTQSNVMVEYHLGTSANISRLKSALLKKDLIEVTKAKNVAISDPILSLWLKKRVWKV